MTEFCVEGEVVKSTGSAPWDFEAFPLGDTFATEDEAREAFGEAAEALSGYGYSGSVTLLRREDGGRWEVIAEA